MADSLILKKKKTERKTNHVFVGQGKKEKRIFFSGYVHTTLEVAENAALILRLRLASTLIRHENRARSSETIRS